MNSTKVNNILGKIGEQGITYKSSILNYNRLHKYYEIR